MYENGYSECLEIGLTKRKDVKPSLLDQNETVAKSYLEVVKNQSILVLCTSGNKVLANYFETLSNFLLFDALFFLYSDLLCSSSK